MLAPVAVALALLLPLLAGGVCLVRARRTAPEGRRWRAPRARWLAWSLAALAGLVFACDLARGVDPLPAVVLLLFWSLPVVAVAWCPWILLTFPVSWIAGGLTVTVSGGWVWERTRTLACPRGAEPQDARIRVRPNLVYREDLHALLHPVWRGSSEADTAYIGLVVLVEGAPQGAVVQATHLFVTDPQGNRQAALVPPDDAPGFIDIGRTSLRDAPDGAPAAWISAAGRGLTDGSVLEVDVEADLPGGTLRRHVVQPVVLSTTRRFGWRPAHE